MDTIMRTPEEITSDLEACTFNGSDVVNRLVWEILDDARAEVEMLLDKWLPTAPVVSESARLQIRSELLDYFIKHYGPDND